MRRAAFVLHRILIGVAAVCLATWTAVKVYAHVEGFRNQALLDRLVRDNRSRSRTADTSDSAIHVTPPHDGALLARIDLPRVGLSTFVLEGTGERWLEQGAGHVPGTALPATDGNVVLAGHRDSFFRGLRRVELADVITVTTPTATRRYAVDSIHVVDPDDTHALAPSRMPELTLITCFPFTYVGAAPQRFVVHAHAIALDDAHAPAFRTSLLALDPTQQTGLGAPPVRQRPSRPMTQRADAHALSSYRLPEPTGPVTLDPPAPRKLPWWKRFFHRHARSRPTDAPYSPTLATTPCVRAPLKENRLFDTLPILAENRISNEPGRRR